MAKSKKAIEKARGYDRWKHMMSRCYDESSEGFKNYGGRGIRVCDRWHDVDAYRNDMGDRPFEGATVDRIDNDGDYSPENCRWADRKTQSTNRRHAWHLIVDGVRMCAADAADALGVKREMLYARKHRGMGFEDLGATYEG